MTTEEGGTVVAWDDPKAAPDPLSVVQGYVNTAHRMRGTDELRTAEGASTALAALGLVDPGEHVDGADRRRLVEFREALRGLLLVHTDGRSDVAAAAAELDRGAGPVPVRVRFSPDGRPTVEPAPAGTIAGRVIALVVVAIANSHDDWTRLKACTNDACRWAFFDASRNRSGRWCDMNVCGARHKMRAYRERHR
jgi:predicted RNA-binding Zn ribbon-like protein